MCLGFFFFITPIVMQILLFQIFSVIHLFSNANYLHLVWYRSAYHSRLPAPSLPHRGPQAEREEQVSL